MDEYLKFFFHLSSAPPSLKSWVRPYCHGLSQQNMVLGAVTKGNGVQGRELWKKKGRLVITLTESWRFQRAISPFGNNNN